MFGSWDLKVGSFSYLVVYLGREHWRIFEGKASSLQDFKLYFLRMLYSWSQVLDGGSKMSLLDFIDKITQESLRAWCFFGFAPFVHGCQSAPWCLLYITILITYKKKHSVWHLVVFQPYGMTVVLFCLLHVLDVEKYVWNLYLREGSNFHVCLHSAF